MKAGIAGVLTRHFIQSPLTPLLLLIALVLGGLALMQLPREEEPQISVPMVDVIVSANGLAAQDAVELVTRPLEDIVKSINQVEHVYSQSEDDHVMVTARFKVGTDEDTAILRVHEQIRAHFGEMPTGITEPLIIGRGIDDVATVVLTLSAKPGRQDHWDDNALFEVAQNLRHEMMKVDNVGLSYIVGGRPNQIRVEPDPEHLALYGISINQLMDKVAQTNRSFSAGAIREADQKIPVIAGKTLSGIPDIGHLMLAAQDGHPVYVQDVARVIVGSAPPEHYTWTMTRGTDGRLTKNASVSLALAKRKGANAVVVAHDILERLTLAQGPVIPGDVQVTVGRNYGQTASDKADELLFHLAIATVSIVILITLLLGWREGLVVLAVIPVTILLTLFASWLMGYTINRVSLFALIFSIGILVDDAIVVIENIARHWEMNDGRSHKQAAIDAVAEVGNPTVVATLTIVVALLPMMFVSGLMGPYMSPIPANASAAMLFSFFVAVILTPWLLLHIHRREPVTAAHERPDRLARFYLRIARPLLTGRRRSKLFLLAVTGATVLACSLFAFKIVTVKLLPFDNKSEVQVVVDLPRDSSTEATDRVLTAAAARLIDLPELIDIQSQAATAAPFNFNGLVRHYALRTQSYQGDLMVNLTSKNQRHRASHTIALDIRERLRSLPVPPGTSIKVVEVPPGPPVLATLLAEIYGPTPEARRSAAQIVRHAFESVDFIVDVDDSFGTPGRRLRVTLDHDAMEFHSVEEKEVYDAIAALMNGVPMGYSQRGGGARPEDIVLRLPNENATPSEVLASTPVRARHGTVELGDVVRIAYEPASFPIYRRDGRFAEMVTADLAGRYEAPIYGMLAVNDELKESGITIDFHGQPLDESHPALLWDGEWEITYITFRDMGAAFAVAIMGIYLLVVAQFGSFRLPLVILVPVPLTLVGIVIGHWLFGAPFTATSMIGFIALAGIIVRNSILLVDFIRHQRGPDHTLRQALLIAGAVRVKPIALTAAAAIIGAAFIITDPIFQGLAISLIFGLASSTALTLLVIPALYIWLRDDQQGFTS